MSLIMCSFNGFYHMFFDFFTTGNMRITLPLSSCVGVVLSTSGFEPLVGGAVMERVFPFPVDSGIKPSPDGAAVALSSGIFTSRSLLSIVDVVVAVVLITGGSASVEAVAMTTIKINQMNLILNVSFLM